MKFQGSLGADVIFVLLLVKFIKEHPAGGQETGSRDWVPSPWIALSSLTAREGLPGPRALEISLVPWDG